MGGLTVFQKGLVERPNCGVPAAMCDVVSMVRAAAEDGRRPVLRRLRVSSQSAFTTSTSSATATPAEPR